ncbi:hypothetical protein NGF19_01630 [Streptomyces sp. RY43-2]|uniref:Integral membrane protein n=1 Tax=Streptomyces macrolidinus TaxID=2952607 RepID=A0ABT0Z6V6_9ACTN|nr:hypothetical protein [Streptomyces macrolidinus]MCN9239495.1 hypothetical protein [Streptomyces macrolidinus]
MERRRNSHPEAAGCLALVAGGLAGYGSYRLSRAARRACAVLLREHPSIFDLWTWEAPLTIVAASFTGLAAWAVPAVALRRCGSGAVRRTAPALSFLVVLAAFTPAHFAWFGTPMGMGSDTGACPADHVPPWWPAWLPS